MKRSSLLLAALLCLSQPSFADSFLFNNGLPNGLMGMASRPQRGSAMEIEAADDFVLASATSITGATVYGLLPAGSSIVSVGVERSTACFRCTRRCRRRVRFRAG